MKKSISLQIPSIVSNISGSISIEAALVLPFIFMLSIGTIEFGWILAQLESAQSATRVAARIASRSQVIAEGGGLYGLPSDTSIIIDNNIAPIFQSAKITNWSTAIDVTPISNVNGALNGGATIFSITATTSFEPVSIGLLLVIGISLPTIPVQYEVRHAGG